MLCGVRPSKAGRCIPGRHRSLAWRRGRGIPAAEVLTTPGLYGDPQLAARSYYQTVDHPVTGKRRYPVWAMRFSFQKTDESESPPIHARATPTLGRHNDEVLGEELGLSLVELDRLREQDAIGERGERVH